uniref:Uncharacterized protein n=1 Tax=Glossina morsitans morsitans TaxID=37546 RepID=A0A1B0GDJ9_GLOMM
MGGLEYRDLIIQNLFTIHKSSEALTPLADMSSPKGTACVTISTVFYLLHGTSDYCVDIGIQQVFLSILL